MPAIMNTSQMQHMMQGALNKMNSSHTTRNNLVEAYKNENDANMKHKLNMEHCDESQKHRRIFLINTSKKVVEPQKIGTQGFKK